jgi:hypothetical protein
MTDPLVLGSSPVKHALRCAATMLDRSMEGWLMRILQYSFTAGSEELADGKAHISENVHDRHIVRSGVRSPTGACTLFEDRKEVEKKSTSIRCYPLCSRVLWLQRTPGVRFKRKLPYNILPIDPSIDVPGQPSKPCSLPTGRRRFRKRRKLRELSLSAANATITVLLIIAFAPPEPLASTTQSTAGLPTPPTVLLYTLPMRSVASHCVVYRGYMTRIRSKPDIS